MMNCIMPFVCVLTAPFFYVNEPVVDMKEYPAHESKIVSQTTFGENVSIEKESEGWVYIHTPDNYTGWIRAHSLVNPSEAYETDLKVSRLSAHIYGIKDTEFGPLKSVPYGTRLTSFDTSEQRWLTIIMPDGQFGYIQRGDVAPEPELKDKGDLVQFSQKFLGLPYTWGGRSSFGYDCSGFVQMLYSQIGIQLQRDSKQQVLDPRLKTISIEELEPGDLVFFGKAADRIMHVVLYIGNGQVIHSTVRECQPWIRISKFTDFEWSADPSAFYPYRICKQLIKSDL